MKEMLEIDWYNVLDMISFLLLGGLLSIIALVFIAAIVHGVYGIWLFSTDRNPFRRKCRKCGQQQEAYGPSYNSTNQWWEDCFPTPDEDCVCHSFARR